MTRAPRRILVADSDNEFARQVRTELEVRGYLVQAAGDGLNALNMVKTGAFDGAIVDADLNAIDGLQVLGGATSLRRRLAVVVTGPRGRPDLERRAKQLGARAYVGKPCSPAEVADALLQGTPSEADRRLRMRPSVTLASLEAGQVLLMECPAGQAEGKLSSRLLAKHPTSLAVAMPRRADRPVALPFGTRVTVGFPMPDGWYQFETSVLGATMYAGEPALLLAQPKVLSHVQRRRFIRSRGIFRVDLESETGIVAGTGQDAGEGGMRVLVEGTVSVGTRVTCMVAASESSPRLTLSGTVIWAQEWRGNGERCRAGIQFAGLSPAERERLRAWVQTLARTEVGPYDPGHDLGFGAPFMS